MPSQWEELKRLFNAASSLPPSEWPLLVASARNRDHELGEKLAALLESHESTDTFLESSPLGINALGSLTQDPGPRLALGSRVGPYEIVSLIGAGSMGEVYRARDERLARDVALKILLADLTGDVSRQRRMEREARAEGMLSHPNIVTVYDVGVYEGSPYIVTELLDGQTLRAALAELSRDQPTGISVDLASRIVREVAAGLSAAHDRGIVHRDLKPENLFVTRGGPVKILDFGLAKITNASGSGTQTTASGTVLGTLGRMAPEQIRGERAGPPADIFAVGTIYYELLSGKRPFEGKPVAEMMATLTGTPVSLRSLRPDVPQAVVAIIDRCLAKEPEARFQSGGELAAALREV